MEGLVYSCRAVCGKTHQKGLGLACYFYTASLSKYRKNRSIKKSEVLTRLICQKKRKILTKLVCQTVRSIEKSIHQNIKRFTNIQNSKKSRTGVCLRTNWKSCFFHDIKHKNRRERKN